MSKTKNTSGLAAVQNLYVMQFELLHHMNSGLRTAQEVQEAKQCLKEFTSLLKVVDPQYMGGEDVLEALYAMHDKMSERVKRHTAKAASKKPASAKATAGKATKKTTKKAVAKKKTAVKKKPTQKKKATKKKK